MTSCKLRWKVKNLTIVKAAAWPASYNSILECKKYRLKIMLKTNRIEWQRLGLTIKSKLACILTIFTYHQWEVLLHFLWLCDIIVSETQNHPQVFGRKMASNPHLLFCKHQNDEWQIQKDSRQKLRDLNLKLLQAYIYFSNSTFLLNCPNSSCKKQRKEMKCTYKKHLMNDIQWAIHSKRDFFFLTLEYH